MTEKPGPSKQMRASCTCTLEDTEWPHIIVFFNLKFNARDHPQVSFPYKIVTEPSLSHFILNNSMLFIIKLLVSHYTPHPPIVIRGFLVFSAVLNL